MDFTPLEFAFLSVMLIWLALEFYCAGMLPGAIWLRTHCRGRWLNHWRMFAESSGKPPHTYRLLYRDKSSGDWRLASLLAHQAGPWALFHCPRLALMTFLFKKAQVAARTPQKPGEAFDCIRDHVISRAKECNHVPDAVRIVSEGGTRGGEERVMVEHPILSDDL